jgi:hypothetical protein
LFGLFFFNKNDNLWVSWFKRSPVADGMSFLIALIFPSVSILIGIENFKRHQFNATPMCAITLYMRY